VYPEKGALARSAAKKPERGLPQEIVVQDFGRLPLEEYVARVATGELGQSREPEALAWLAMAARTYAAWFMAHEGLGTGDKPFPNSQQKQVAARVATPAAIEATARTRNGLITHNGRMILASHVAGAVWPPGASNGRNGKDAFHTEKWVTYNAGQRGRNVALSPIASMHRPDNRGCLSQEGAMALATRGEKWPDILRYFYGDDIAFTIPDPTRRGPGASPNKKPADSAGFGEVLLLAAGAYGAYRLLG
jgi:hypothetical protein